MANNNDDIFNAAIAAYMGAIYVGSQPDSSTQSDYDPEVATSVQFATAIDAAIPHDAGMDAAHANLLFAIAFAAQSSRNAADGTLAATFGDLAAAINAVYQNAAANLV